MSALAGLGALGDLDLQDLRIDKVVWGHAEAAGGNLLDFGNPLGAKPLRVLATLAGIGTCAHSVHGRRQRLVGLGTERTQGHARGIEPRQDLLHRLHFVQRQRHGRLHRLQQVTQRGNRPGVDQAGVALVHRIVAASHRLLQCRHHIRVEGVVLLAVHIFEQAALFDGFTHRPGPAGKRFLILLQLVEIGAFDAR